MAAVLDYLGQLFGAAELTSSAIAQDATPLLAGTAAGLRLSIGGVHSDSFAAHAAQNAFAVTVTYLGLTHGRST